MRPALTTWLLGGFFALGPAAWAQVPPERPGTSCTHFGTVRPPWTPRTIVSHLSCDASGGMQESCYWYRPAPRVPHFRIFQVGPRGLGPFPPS